MGDAWYYIPHYPDYLINPSGVIWNVRLNHIVEGAEHGNQRRVAIKSEDGFFHQYNISRLMEMVDFSQKPVETLGVRMIRIVGTDELFDRPADVAAYLLTDVSSIYRVLRGDRPAVMGHQLEYVYL